MSAHLCILYIRPEVQGASGPQLLVGGPWGLLTSSFVSLAHRLCKCNPSPRRKRVMNEWASSVHCTLWTLCTVHTALHRTKQIVFWGKKVQTQTCNWRGHALCTPAEPLPLQTESNFPFTIANCKLNPVLPVEKEKAKSKTWVILQFWMQKNKQEPV